MDKARVLIVTNDKLAQNSLYKTLCRHGYEVDLSESAKDALTHLAEKPSHVLVADLDGTSDGMESLKILKERTSHLEIVILASLGNMGRASNKDLETFHYLAKPVEDENLISA